MFSCVDTFCVARQENVHCNKFHDISQERNLENLNLFGKFGEEIWPPKFDGENCIWVPQYWVHFLKGSDFDRQKSTA